MPHKRRFLINWVLPVAVVTGLGGGLGAVIQFSPMLNPSDPGQGGSQALPPLVAEWLSQTPPI